MGTKTALKIESFPFFDNSRFMTTEWCKARITTLALPIRESSSLSCFPSLVNAIPRYLNFSTCFSFAPFTYNTNDQGFLKDEVPQLWPCLFSFRQCCMHLQSYLLLAGGQILRKKAEPNHQRIADAWFCNLQSWHLISLAAFVDQINMNNEKERWQNAPLPESNAHMEQLWLLAIYQNTKPLVGNKKTWWRAAIDR